MVDGGEGAKFKAGDISEDGGAAGGDAVLDEEALVSLARKSLISAAERKSVGWSPKAAERSVSVTWASGCAAAWRGQNCESE